MKNNLSERKYVVHISDNVTDGIKEMTFNELMQNPTGDEFIFAAQEDVDSVLDLRNGQSMYFSPNRDDAESKGIIKRVR